MTYTQLALAGVLLAVLNDLYLLRTKLVTRRIFWVSNGVLTGLRTVRYNGDVIIGSSTPIDGPPPMFGDGRVFFAPVEDLFFGFALVLLSLTLWVWLGRRGVEREPMSGPPRFRNGNVKK
ncbi:MAG: lycopene cyclase domain-containing protein [Actinobacteria bacterium]|nr:lycopene cyclase domain-containing protein [Actinomycetota bacterium]